MSRLATTSRIAELNDTFREAGPLAEGLTDGSGQWVFTSGVSALGGDFLIAAINAVRTFSIFNENNDPHHEHDFGAFGISDQRLFWKIDYYDRTMQYGSENPLDPALTCRVMTIMLTEEY